MLLVVDVGNTDIVFGFYEDQTWKAVLRTPTHQPWSANGVVNWIKKEWASKDLGDTLPSLALISSVVPSISPQIQRGLALWLGYSPVQMNPKLYESLPIQVIAPEEIGSDLVANAVYAHENYKSNVLIVDFGTALTFTLVNAEGKMEGVSIAPGLKTAVKSLFSQTAQLPEVPLEMPEFNLGTDTVSAIQAGILWGYVGMVKEMTSRVKEDKKGDLKVVATGGLSSILTPLASYFDEVNKLITLEGLRLIAERLKAPKPMFPKEQGYFFPAEWHPHLATWITFPHNDHSWQEEKLRQMYPEYFALIKAISEGEQVRINVNSADLQAFVESQLPVYGIDPAKIEFNIQPTNDAWCRDHGPAFLVKEGSTERLVVNWEYNAWGGKYPPYSDDNALPATIATHLTLLSVSPGIIMEGGSVDFNGAGTVLTSRSCLLNPNRNPHLSQEQIETYLKNYYGVSQVLWVSDGIVGDDTDGHIDDTVRFVNANTVIAMVEPNEADDNHAVLAANLAELKQMTLLDGSPLQIVEIPMPDAVVIDGFRAPGSYANFYICNAGVLVPIFGCPQDEVALGILRQLFTDRPVIGLSAREIIWGQGSFHCLTQQEPAPCV